MKYYYKILVQMAHPDAPNICSEPFFSLFQEGIDFFNSKSLTCKNSKTILDYKIVDNHTWELILGSENYLEQPGRGLRVLSVFLSKAPLMRPYIYGTNLLKMSCTAIKDYHSPGLTQHSNSFDTVRLKLINHIISASEEDVLKAMALFEGEVSKNEY